jgi:glutaredoxin
MKKDITIYFNPACPYCHMALEFLAAELPKASVEKISVADGGKSREKFFTALNRCGFDSTGIPLIIVGEKCFQGFDPAIGREIKRAVKG